MKMIATCGHEIKWEEQKSRFPVFGVKIIMGEDVHAISWRTLCPKCVEKYERLGTLLRTKKEQDEWLYGG